MYVGWVVEIYVAFVDVVHFKRTSLPETVSLKSDNYVS